MMIVNSSYAVAGMQEIAHGLLHSVSGGADLSNDPTDPTDPDPTTSAQGGRN
jgi:hypothetical protein